MTKPNGTNVHIKYIPYNKINVTASLQGYNETN